MDGCYSTGEFAKRTGVSVRTLQYYDELGLLTAQRSDANRRYYNDSHFLTMQRIVTLKFLGFSLEEIKVLLAQEHWNLKEFLQLQRKLLEEKINQMTKVLHTINHAIVLADEKEPIDAGIFTSIIQGVQFQDEHKEWLQRIYSEDKVDEIFSISAEEQQQLEKRFMQLLTTLKEKTDEDPAGEETQQIIQELMDMLTEIIGEDLHSIFEKIDDANLEEDDSMLPLPLTTGELDWIRKAIEIFMENAKRKVTSDERK